MISARTWRALETALIPTGAIALSLAIFGAFVTVAGANAADVYYEMYRGAFGTSFSFQNTLLRAAPIMLTALCTAIPASLGLVIIGGEGALVLGALASVVAAHALAWQGPWMVLIAMGVAGALVGGVWIGFAGALRAYRGVNETISSCS